LEHFLKRVPLFADLPEEDLDRLCDMIEVVKLPRGEVLFEEGSVGDKAYVIEEGELEILKHSGEREVLLAVRKSGEVIGEMSLLEESPRMASVRARSDCRLLTINQDQLNVLVRTSASAARAMFYTVLSRWRSTGAVLRQSEKMAQLGTLTAGVAHELNNPAAAVARGTDQLNQAVATWGHATLAFAKLELTGPKRASLEEMEADVRARSGRPAELDALARADREEELEDWMDDQGIEDPWDLAPALVDLDMHLDKLESMSEAYGLESLPTIISWLSGAHGVYSLLAEINHGSQRISKIVGALKQYSFLDQAPVQEVDVAEGIDNTLLILRNKLKAGISVKREYEEDLPRILAHGSELNQVWTNLLDNACDALEGSGTIKIRTCFESDWIMVEIEDDGPGIPTDIQERVFDPFFTTKAPGKGTGQGLDIVWRIVVNNHRGSITLFSQPGCTRFQITLPVNFEEASGTPEAVEVEKDVETWIIENTKTIAVVGVSDNEDRAAHTVPRYLHRKGYEIIGVNPKLTEVFGAPAVARLEDIDRPVDTVLIFRRSDAVPPIVDSAVAIGAKAVWMQPGIIHSAAAEAARREGLKVVQDTCMRSFHKRWTSDQP